MDTSVSAPAKQQILPYLAIAAGILALSLSAMFIRWANAPGPVTGFYRLAIASVILTPVIARRWQTRPVKFTTILWFPVLGGIFTALDLAFWTTSVQYTTAANATLLGNTSPLWVAITAWLFFKEPLKRDFWIGLVLALAGATLVMGLDFFIHPRFGIGDLMASAAAIFYAGYFLSTQFGRKHYDPLSYIWLVGVVASLGLLVINGFLGHPMTGYPNETWWVFIATAVVSQLIGYLSISYALGHLPASVVAPTMIGQPVLTTILAIPLLGEIPYPLQILGGVLALAGIYLIHQAHNRNKRIAIRR